MQALRHALVLMIFAASALAQGGGGPGGGPPSPPLPPVPVPAANPFTPAKSVLGKILFWDEQLSSDNTMACGTCHIPTANGTDPRIGLNPGPDGLTGTADDKRGSPGVIRSDANNDYLLDAVFGVQPQVTSRTAPTMINAAFAPSLFWDGRAPGQFVDPQGGGVVIPAGAALESQAVGPPLSSAEMAHDSRTWAQLTSKLATATPLKLASNLPFDTQLAIMLNPTYPALFNAAFGSPAITAARIGMAIATYERTLISDQTPFDVLLNGNPMALTMQQANGMNIFFGPGQCNVCHTAPVLSNGTFRNVGLRPPVEDQGRFDVTGNNADRGRFRVPSLRNVGLKNRFMHNGQFMNLGQVIAFYARGGDFPFNQDPVMGAIAIPPGPPQNDLRNFLENALTDPRVAAGLPPFDRPTLNSELTANDAVVLGSGIAGSGGFTPQTLAGTPSSLGNVDFRVGLAGAPDATAVYLTVSGGQAPSGTMVGDLSVYANLADPNLAVMGFATGGSAAGEGTATAHFPIPNVGFLAGFKFVTQWFVFDAGSSSNVFDFTASDGVEFTIF